MKINQDGKLIEEGLTELSFTIPRSYLNTADENLKVCYDEDIEADYIEFADLVKLCMNQDGSIANELIKTKVWVGRFFEYEK